MQGKSAKESGSHEGLSLMGWASERTERELAAFFGRKGGVHLTPGLHLTLFAHLGAWPDGVKERDILQALPSLLEVQLAGLQLWRRPQMDGGQWTVFAQDFLISPLISPDAERTHEKIKTLGFEHAYGEFVPHLTLARSHQTLDISAQFLEEYGRFIAKQRLVASFDRWEIRPMQTPNYLRALPMAGFPKVNPEAWEGARARLSAAANEPGTSRGQNAESASKSFVLDALSAAKAQGAPGTPAP